MPATGPQDAPVLLVELPITNVPTSGRGWMGRVHPRAGALLIVGEIMLGFVLVTGAVLSARTLSKVEQIRPGFEPRQLLVFQVSNGVPWNKWRYGKRSSRPWRGVESLGATSHLPLDTDIPNWYSPFQPEGMNENVAATLILGSKIHYARLSEGDGRAASGRPVF